MIVFKDVFFTIDSCGIRVGENLQMQRKSR